MPDSAIGSASPPRIARAAAIFVVGICALPASAASVFVKSLDYDRADVVINRAEPRMLWVGDTTPEGVVLRGVADGAAALEVDGRVWTLRPGEGTYAQATLRTNGQGQFFLMARVNDVALPALIDTGATSVTLNSEDADRLGIDFRDGQRVVARTASGPVSAYLVTLASVQVGDIVLTEVPGSVIEVGRNELPLVLVGMSFLGDVTMQRAGDTMLLRRSHY